MRKNRLYIALTLASGVFISNCNDRSQAGAIAGETTVMATDPLLSWNEGELRNDIIAYIKKGTDSNSLDFIPVENRITNFDNDGTLWAKRPYVQELFAPHQIREMVKSNSEFASQQNYKSGAGWNIQSEMTFNWAAGTTMIFLLGALTGIARLGKQMVSLEVGPRIPVTGSISTKPDFGLRAAVTLVFPK